MTALNPANCTILRGLAAQLGLKPIWSTSSGDAPSDVNDWLGYVLSDTVNSPQLIALREQVRVAIGSNVTPGATRMFKYYRDLLDSAASAPALFVSGQSNAGNRDLVNPVVDARVTFTW